MAVEPAAFDDREAVQMRYVVCGEEGGEDVADETANGVLGEDVEGVVDAEDELELGCVLGVLASVSRGEGGDTYIGTGGSDDTVDDGRPGWDVTGPGSDGYETGDDTGAETDSGPLAFKTVIQDTPCDTSDAGSQVGNDGCHDGAEVGSESRTCVEAEPSNPQEDGANDDVCHVVGAVVELVSAVATTLAQHDRVCESSASRRDMHGSSTGEIETSHLEDPSGGVPCPAGDRVVDDGCPDEHEDLEILAPISYMQADFNVPQWEACDLSRQRHQRRVLP